MGLYIHLTAQLNRIEPAEWEAAYQDSLTLLQRFPAKLVRPGVQQIKDYKRYFNSNKIVCNPGKKDEYWLIYGDRDSGRCAETFSLKRYPERKTYSSTEPEVDVLWASEENIDYSEGTGVELFGDKTQGYPFHLALLAVAALFEHYFPERCFVLGDIDIESTQQVIRWASGVLSTQIGLPVCCDGEALYRRLVPLYNDPKLVIKRFDTLFRGSDEEQLQILLKNAEPECLYDYLVELLNSYDFLSQYGAISILSNYLTVTQNVEAVINLVQLANRSRAQEKEDEFSLKELLKVLCRHFVTIDFAEREALFALSRPANLMANIENTFSQLFLSLAGAPQDIRFHIDKTNLLEIFSAHVPEQRETFREIIATEEEHCRTSLTKLNESISEIQPAQESSPAIVQKSEGATIGHVIKKEDIVDANDKDLPGLSYIIQQIEEQRKRIPGLKKILPALGTALGKIIQENQDVFGSPDRQYYLNIIGRAGEKNGIRLWRKTWKNIDEETDLEILKRLTALFIISEREINFWDLRIYLLEHRKLWPYLLNPSRLKKIARATPG